MGGQKGGKAKGSRRGREKGRGKRSESFLSFCFLSSPQNAKQRAVCISRNGRGNNLLNLDSKEVQLHAAQANMAVLPKVRTGYRGGTPSWGRSPRTPYFLSLMRNAISGEKILKSLVRLKAMSLRFLLLDQRFAERGRQRYLLKAHSPTLQQILCLRLATSQSPR